MFGEPARALIAALIPEPVLARISHQGAGWRFSAPALHRIRASMHIIAQGFGFTRDFLKERNNSAYCRLKKIPCEFKKQARSRHPGEKCGLRST
jgi:hypothetical protein